MTYVSGPRGLPMDTNHRSLVVNRISNIMQLEHCPLGPKVPSPNAFMWTKTRGPVPNLCIPAPLDEALNS